VRTAEVINLERRRRERDGEPSISAACVLVDQFIQRMDFAPAVAARISKALGFVLMAIVDGNPDAIRAWKRIEREILSPFRAHDPGEPGYGPLIDRLVIVDALALHFRMMQQ
jgi:hypothetical protein